MSAVTTLFGLAVPPALHAVTWTIDKKSAPYRVQQASRPPSGESDSTAPASDTSATNRRRETASAPDRRDDSTGVTIFRTRCRRNGDSGRTGSRGSLRSMRSVRARFLHLRSATLTNVSDLIRVPDTHPSALPGMTFVKLSSVLRPLAPHCAALALKCGLGTARFLPLAPWVRIWKSVAPSVPAQHYGDTRNLR